jgi:hypothetical protein
VGTRRKRRGLLVVWMASVIHIVWGALLTLPHTSAGMATPTAGLLHVWNNPVGVGFSLIGIAALALFSVNAPIRATTALLGLFPQQFALAITAGGALGAMAKGHYADGVPRPATFIVADQLPMVVALLAHTTVLILIMLSVRKGGFTDDRPVAE